MTVRSGFERRVLGRTGLTVGPLGISSSYGMPAAAVEEAFDRGCNYLYWGTFRRAGFGQGIRNLRRQRESMVLVLQSYWPVAGWIGPSIRRGLKRLSFDYADVLLLGYWSRPVPPQVLDVCAELKRTGVVRHLAVSSHNRTLLGKLAENSPVDIFHLRYNAVHRGAEQDVFPHLRPELGIVSYTATSWAQLLNPKLTPKGEPTPSAADCYRFALSHPAVHVCMTGPGNLQQTREALTALDRGPMEIEELAWMRRVGDAIHKRR